MYEAFFNLKHKPFSLLPDPEFLFLSDKHAIALSLLEYCLSGQAGFCVITGDIGSGKTTLIRAFLGRIGRNFSVGLISNTHGGLVDIAAWAMNAFAQKPSSDNQAETYQELMAYLIAEYGAGRQCILIVDEAQNLSLEALEELRLLSNINTGKDLLLQMVLVGQPELLEKLRRPELSQFAQRIAVSHHLTPLPFADSRRYIEHRLKIAGAERPIFTEMAMGAVQYFSGGVPRLINSICDMTLVYAFADGATTINEEMVFRVVADRQRSGIAPFATAISADDPAIRATISDLARSGTVAERPHIPKTDKAAPAALTEESVLEAPAPAAKERVVATVPAAKELVVPVAPAAKERVVPVAPAAKERVFAAAPTIARDSAAAAPASMPAAAMQTAVPPAVSSGETEPEPEHPVLAAVTDPTSNGELYFSGGDEETGDEDELLLTLPVSDEPAADGPHPARPDERSSTPTVAAALMANPEDRIGAPIETHITPSNPEVVNVALIRPTEAMRPTWRHPAATLDSQPWPSISRHDTERVAKPTEELVATIAISGPTPGTSAPSRRSWWRRGLSRRR